MNSQAPAGWYPQPDGTQRYWDGTQWTEHVAPGAPVAAHPMAAESSPQASAQVSAAEASVVASPAAGYTHPWWKKKAVVIPGVGVALVVLIGIVVASVSNGGTDEPAAGATPSHTYTTVSPSPDATTFTMPNLVGRNLQESQDALQALGSHNLKQTDASGQGREQLFDSNWVVCDQTPKPGVDASIAGEVVLASVKATEACPGDETATAPTPKETPAPVETPAPKESPAPKETPKADEPDEVSLTAEQVQAVGVAGDYLDYSAFSRKSLIDQLEFEGFSKKIATFAVDYLDVDWRTQSVKMAEQYIDYSAFSKKGLIDQLEYEGFSESDASYGAGHIDVDWNEQAALMAQSYLEFDHFSHSGLVDQLEYEGFTSKQAEYGVKQAGL